MLLPLMASVMSDAAAVEKTLTTRLEASQKEAKALEGRMNNGNFIERAKPEAVEKAKADFAHHLAEATQLSAAIERLGRNSGTQ